MPTPARKDLKDRSMQNDPDNPTSPAIVGSARVSPSVPTASSSNGFPCCSSEVAATTINIEESVFAPPFFQSEPIHTPGRKLGMINLATPFVVSLDDKSRRTADIDSFQAQQDDIQFSEQHWKVRVESQLDALERRIVEHQQMFDSINRKITYFTAPVVGGRLSKTPPNAFSQPIHSDVPEGTAVESEELHADGNLDSGNGDVLISGDGLTFVEECPSSKSGASITPSQSIQSMHELQAEVLDKAEMYEANDSIWDMAFFICLRYLGCGTSVVITCVFVLNIVVQVWFCVIIWTYMLDGPVETDFLDELLRFRVAVAHNADYADKLNMRSMASQICTEDEKLHLSGRQFGMRIDMAEFYDGAMPLCILTILCWVIKILGESSESIQFLRMVWSIRRGSSTTVLLNNEAVEKSRRISDHFRDGIMEQLSAAQAADLLKLHVVVRVISLTYGRAMYASLFVALPRVIISILLGVVGVAYLSITSKMEELLLNGMALAFIADIDEILYLFFIPRRAKTFMGNLEPLPVVSLGRKLRNVWITSILKLVLVGILSVVITWFFTLPFFDGLKQATDILCSGDKDFVVGVSKATGMLHATKSKGVGDWTASDYAVLQLARPKFHLAEWDVSQTIFDALDSSVTDAVIEPRVASLAVSKMSRSSFEFVAGLSSLPIADSLYLACEDMSAGQSRAATVKQLQAIVGNSSITGCKEDWYVIKPLCAKLEMTQLRAICPRTCGCAAILPQHIGFFAHSSWGCPTACSSIRLASEGYEYDKGIKRTCADTKPPTFFLEDPFKLTEGTEGGPEVMLTWFANYLKGMFTFLSWRPGFEVATRNNVKIAAAVGLVPSNKEDAVVDSILTGEMANTILSGSWALAPGVYHPRHFEGCEFLTSPEFTFMLGVQLCDDSEFYSLRFICPGSCDCGSLNGCPLECKRQTLVLPCTDMQDGHFPEATVASLQWILKSKEVYHCPYDGPQQSLLHKLCSFKNMTVLRQICPLACQCHVPGSPLLGFFGGTPEFGCPASCTHLQKAVVRFQHNTTGVPCFDALAEWFTVSNNYFGNFFQTWSAGFVEWYLQDPAARYFELSASLGILASGEVVVPLFTHEDIPKLAVHLVEGGILTLLTSGSWDLLLGVPHPRGLKGCEYLTSYEVLIVYGIDFCSVGKFTSLRSLCPISCDCHDGMTECQYGCDAD